MAASLATRTVGRARSLLGDLQPAAARRASADGPAKAAAQFAVAVRIAVGHGDVISFSASYGEHFFTGAEVATTHSALEYAAARHVTFVAGTGDYGAISDLGELRLVHAS
jgi:hypothetical protein